MTFNDAFTHFPREMNHIEQPNSIDMDLISSLARLELSEDEKSKLVGQMGNILKYFDKLKQVDVSGVEPMAHASPICNVWRDDSPGENFTIAEVLLNAPEESDNQLVVPKIVD